jgi:transcriptional regulator with XRE-family HTH domain
MPKYTEEQRKAAGRALEKRIGELRLTRTQVAQGAKVDVQTVSALIEGRRWPQLGSRTRIEEAVGWDVGHLSDLAEGLVEDAADSEPADPVTAAIERSELTRANKYKLLGYYEELLASQMEVRTG